MRDFWGWLQELNEEMAKDFSATSCEKERQAVRAKWHGIAMKLPEDSFFADAKRSAQRVFVDCLRNGIENQERYHRAAWKLLDECAADSNP